MYFQSTSQKFHYIILCVSVTGMMIEYKVITLLSVKVREVYNSFKDWKSGMGERHRSFKGKLNVKILANT